MSQEKAQLIAPLGNVTFSGVTATGVITATSLEGNITGAATSIKQGTSITAGVVTASSFAGNLTGNIQRLADSAPNISVGVVTATSFSGNLTGSVTDLTGTPTISVGIVTATTLQGALTGDVTGNVTGNVSGVGTGSVTGNVTGLAASVRSGVNLRVGVCTGIEFYGDGSNLTGAGSTAFIAQEITADGYGDGGVTVIDLSDGNLIYYKGDANTTVGFASTSAAEQIVLVRDAAPATYDIDMSTASVDFDSGDNITQTADAVLRNWFDQAFTVEYWIKADSLASTDGGSGNVLGASTLGSNSNFTWSFGPNGLGQVRFGFWTGSSETAILPTQTLSTGIWYHLAFVHDGSNNCKIFIDGVLGKEATLSNGAADGGAFNVGKVQTANFDGKISNLRITHQALYSDNFIPPTGALTTTSQGAIASNVKLLCCQSSTDDTAATVTPSAFSANGTPTPGAETITQSGSFDATITWPNTVTWNDGTAPTLKYSSLDNSPVQIFRFTTGDTGATYQAWEEIEYVTNADPTTYTAGTIFTWGRQTYNGVLGLNDANNRSSPTQVGTDATWEKISFNTGTGQNAAMYAIKSDATGWVWGDNSEGQQGQNNQGASNNEYSSPVQIPGSWSLLGGDTSAAGIKPDGTLWMWGRNSDGGNLGLDDNTARSSPTQVGSDTNWATGRQQISLAENFTQAIKTDGTLWFWGGNGYGEYGHISPMNTKYSSPVQIGNDTNWNSIYSHAGCILATKMDNSLWTWGHNDKGMLGHNKGPGNNLSSPTQLPGSWSQYVFGWYRSSGCVKTDGTLWTWGNNENGALGLNQPDNTEISSPTQVGTDTTWSYVVGRGILGGAAALKTDGTLWVWGSNSYGALGLNQGGPHSGAAYARSSPVQIPGTNWKQVTSQNLSILAQQSS